MNLILFQVHAEGSVTRVCACGQKFKATVKSRSKTCPQCVSKRRAYAASCRWVGLSPDNDPMELFPRDDEREPSEVRPSRATPLWATSVKIPDIVDDDLVSPCNPHGTEYVDRLSALVEACDPKYVPPSVLDRRAKTG